MSTKEHAGRVSSPVARFAASALAFGALFQAQATAQVQVFGEWEGAGTIELTVGPAAAFPTITAALAAANAAGLIGAVPVTINVESGVYSLATGEIFPIVIPAHGVTIEALNIAVGGRPALTAVPGGATELILIGSVGNEELPPSTIRGLSLFNTFQIPNSADIRIDMIFDEKGRVAPEIRDCIITGEPSFGVQMVADPGIVLEAVMERNLVTAIDPFFGVAGIDILGAGGISSPLIRANEVQLYQSNVRVVGGGLDNQPRIQSNFIQNGNINVELGDCAPFIVNNTIAFAETNTPGGTATGITWTGVPEMTLSNNLIWNPGDNRVDVAGPLGVFAANPARQAFANVDEDDTLFAASVASVPGVITLFATNPNPPFFGFGPPLFLGGDLPGLLPGRDLHLSPASWLIGSAFVAEVSSGLPQAATFAALPGGLDVRTDVAYDIDFEGRIQGVSQLFTSVDVGADEVTTFDPIGITQFNRGAVLQWTQGALGVNSPDELGNLLPDAAGNWTSQIEVTGQPGDIVVFMAGFGFADDLIAPPLPLLENRSVYQNGVLLPGLIPDVVTETSIGVEIGANTLNWFSGVIPAGGTLVAPITLGAANAALTESELQIQALVLGSTPIPSLPNALSLQSTARLTLEVNL